MYTGPIAGIALIVVGLIMALKEDNSAGLRWGGGAVVLVGLVLLLSALLAVL